MKLPATIAKYELQKFLGGGMPEVYQAKDLVLGRTVAVKLLAANAAQDPDTRARFLLEARVSSGIAHENVITTHDYGEQDGIPYMVLEFLTGQTLKDALRDSAALPLRARVSIGAQLARALAHVHSLGLVHRDVKPDNVHIDAQRHVKLMDFGIVKTGDVTLTQAGYSLGTPHYVAPELVLGQAATPLADVYSFGVLLYELLTGKRAIQADTVERIFYQILNEDIPLAPLAASGVPFELESIVRGAIVRDPQFRTQSMAAVAAELDEWLTTNAAQAQRVPAGPPPFRRVRLSNWWIAGAAIFSMVLAGAIGFLFLTSQKAVARIDDSLGEMTFIPPGRFLFGPEKRPVNLRGFFIDLAEVTNEEYERFCQATGHPLPPGYERGNPGLPIVNVSLADAKDFAKWAGKRLPTEQEWQKAARGEDGRLFPWGDLATAARANVADNPDNSRPRAVSVDAFRLGRSPYMALQMAGNVREFTAEVAPPTVAAMREYADSLVPPPGLADEWVIVKGGSFRSKLAESSLVINEIVPARYRAADLGFRCVKDR